MVCTPPQNLAKTKKSNKIVKNGNFEKLINIGLDYVLKNIPTKFGDAQSILRLRKLGMMNLTDRQNFFSLVDSWSYRPETPQPKFFLGRLKKITDGSGVP